MICSHPLPGVFEKSHEVTISCQIGSRPNISHFEFEKKQTKQNKKHQQQKQTYKQTKPNRIG